MTPPTGEEYTHVMSYNLYVGNTNKAAALAVIQAQSPDIFGVQEASTAWLSYLTENLTDYGVIGFGRDSTGADCETATATGNAGEGCYIFYRKSMFTVSEAKTYWFSDTPTQKSQFSCETDNYYRVFTYAKLKRIADGKELVFCNTHLELTAEARALEVSMLLQYLTPYLDAKLPVVVTGDFNMDSSETAAFGQFATAGLQSASAVATNKGSVVATFPSGNAFIDYIMCSENMEVNYYSVVTDSSNSSDHRPVGAWLKY